MASYSSETVKDTVYLFVINSSLAASKVSQDFSSKAKIFFNIYLYLSASFHLII